LAVNLEELHLNDNQIRSLDVKAFAGLTQLRELNLYGNKISVLEQHVLDCLINLEELYFYNNQNYSIDARLFINKSNLRVAELFIEETNNIREIRSLLVYLLL
jgi:Leucine-rich repeat (LRR) protein